MGIFRSSKWQVDESAGLFARWQSGPTRILSYLYLSGPRWMSRMLMGARRNIAGYRCFHVNFKASYSRLTGAPNAAPRHRILNGDLVLHSIVQNIWKPRWFFSTLAASRTATREECSAKDDPTLFKIGAAFSVFIAHWVSPHSMICNPCEGRTRHGKAQH